MKKILLNLFLYFSLLSTAATYSWRDVGVIPNGVWDTSLKGYLIHGQIYGEMPYLSIGGTDGQFIGYKDEAGFHLKQCDQNSTPMAVGNDVWVLAVYGEMLSHDTIYNVERIELCDFYDFTATGGTLIETPEDFYLGFMGRGYREFSDRNWFGWLHLSVSDDLEMTILDKGIGLNGEPVRVGIGPIPEPSCVLLALLGGALLVLRRKNLCCLRWSEK